jgi:group I intron endonuclease
MLFAPRRWDMFRQREWRNMMETKTKKELNREYLERVKPAGVFQIKNTVNGKILLGSSLNLEGPLNKHKFMLKIGSHKNKALLEDWKQYGEEQFAFEILEVVDVKDDPNFNLKDELTLLEEIWLEKLNPFGEKGYNSTDGKIREV